MPFQTPPPPNPPAQVQKQPVKKKPAKKRAAVKQQSSGPNSPNIVTGDQSPVTVNPPKDVVAGKLEPSKILIGNMAVGPAPILEIGDSGSRIALMGQQGKPVFGFWNDSNLLIEDVAGTVVVSTSIRDASGKLIAEIIRNEWKTQPSLLWDRNFDKNKLEVRDDAGYVVLQVISLPGVIQIQGVWRDSHGHSFGLVKSSDPNRPGGFMISNRPITEMRIEPIFKYPSDLHLGELAK
jgi:hypothetical protein